MCDPYKYFLFYLILSNSIPSYHTLPYPFIFLLKPTTHYLNFKADNSITCSLKSSILEILKFPDEYRIKDKITEELVASNMT